jgi:transposase
VQGVSVLSALTFVATIDDPKRFSSSRSLGAYLGLVPRSYQSGDSDPHLHTFKAGDVALRALMVAAAAYIIAQGLVRL